MSRKAQMQQTFIYLAAILIIGFLILFGYRMIDKLFTQRCEVADQQFITQLQEDLDSGERYLSRTHSILTAPCDFTKLCFVNTPNITAENKIDSIEGKYPTIWANTKDGIEYNVYLLKEGQKGYTAPVMFDQRIRTINPEDGTGDEVLCVNSSNRQFSLWMTGYGKNGIHLHTKQ